MFSRGKGIHSRVPTQGWIVDADLKWSLADLPTMILPAPFIPGAIDRTASVGRAVEQGRWSEVYELRYFGSRSLIEDNSVRSDSSTLVSAKLGYTIQSRIASKLAPPDFKRSMAAYRLALRINVGYGEKLRAAGNGRKQMLSA